MDKIPLFTKFEQFMSKAYQDLINAIKAGKWLLIILYLFIVGFIITVFISGALTVFSGGIRVIKDLFPEPENKPSLALSYDRVTQEKDEDNLYRSVFNIQVHSPIGNKTTTFKLWNNLKGETECELSQLGQTIEARAGMASSTMFLQASCISRKPIIDAGDLFTLQKGAQSSNFLDFLSTEEDNGE